MNKTVIIFFVTCFISFSFGCKQKDRGSASNGNLIVASMSDSLSVYVYYFHGKQRCPTCNAVEELAKETVAELNQKGAKAHFIAVNREDKSNMMIIEKFNVISNALIVCKGTDHSDLTYEAFNYALNKKDRVVNHLRNEIDKRLE